MSRRPTPKKAGSAEDLSADVVESTAEVAQVSVPTAQPEVEQVRVQKTIPDEDQIQLINVTLAVNTCMVPAGDGAGTIRVKPFQATPLMPKSWASKIIGAGGRTDRGFENGSKGRFVGYHWRQWVPLAPKGAREEVVYKAPDLASTYQANRNREDGAVSPDGAPIIHSEVQALNFLRHAPDRQTIQAFIDSIDGRPVVRLFAQDMINLRDEQHNERTQIQVVQRKRHVAPR